jgi:serine/threonine protein kinase
MGERSSAVPEKPEEKHPELEAIFAVMGTPTPDEVARIRTPEAQAHIALYGVLPPRDLATMLPAASPDAMDLLKQFLTFCPEARITADAALAHPYFASIRQPDTEVCRHFVHTCSPAWVVSLSFVDVVQIAAAAPVRFEDVTPLTIFPRLQEIIEATKL